VTLPSRDAPDRVLLCSTDFADSAEIGSMINKEQGARMNENVGVKDGRACVVSCWCRAHADNRCPSACFALSGGCYSCVQL